MKKLLLLSALLIQINAVFAQKENSGKTVWSAWKASPCFPNLYISARCVGYTESIKSYEYQFRFKNTAMQNMHFNFEILIAKSNEALMAGRFDVGAGQEYTHVGSYAKATPDINTAGFFHSAITKYIENAKDDWSIPSYSCGSNGVKFCDQNCNPIASVAAGNARSSGAPSGNNNTTNTPNSASSTQSSTEYWTYYNQATAAGKAGNYDLAISNWESAIRFAVNDAQRDNAKAWLAEVQKAKSNSAGTTSTYSAPSQSTQSTYTPQQTKSQQQVSALNQLSNSLMDLAKSMDQAKADKLAKQKKEAADLRAQQNEEHQRVEAANFEKTVYSLIQYVGRPGEKFKSYFSGLGYTYKYHEGIDNRNEDLFENFTIKHYMDKSVFVFGPQDGKTMTDVLNQLVDLREYITFYDEGNERKSNGFSLTNAKGHSTQGHGGGVEEDYSYVLKYAAYQPQPQAAPAVVAPVARPYTPSARKLNSANVTDQSAAFEGNFTLFLQRYSKYPVALRGTKIQGDVSVSFTVTKDGLTNIKAISGPKELYESAEEVVRKSSERWIPERQNNKFVDVRITRIVTYVAPQD